MVKKGLLLKMDFEKAYNYVNWEFLNLITEKMKFGMKWCGWIMECASTAASIYVLINDTPMK